MTEWRSTAIHPDKFIKEYREYLIDDDLARVVNGKRVAYVCPAPITGEGQLIDSYDIVIRVGVLHTIPDNNVINCGSRTDVIVHSFNQLEIEEARKNMDFLSGVKFILCSMVSYDFKPEHDTFLNEMRAAGIPAQNVADEYLYGLFRKVGTICNVGFAGLMTLLHYDVKEVYITGMTFYNMGKYGHVYGDEYYDMVTRDMGLYDGNEQKTTSAEQARSDLHDQPAQIEYFRGLIQNEPRIKLSGFLTKNFL